MMPISLFFKHLLTSSKFLIVMLAMLFASTIATPQCYGVTHPNLVRSDLTNEAEEGQIETVIIDGVTLFKVYGNSVLPAKKRAKDIAERIRVLAQDTSFDPATLEIQDDNDDVIKVMARGKLIFGIIEKDAQIEGMPSALILTKGLILPKVIDAIKTYRSERERAYLLKNLLRAFLTTLFLLLLIFITVQSFKKIESLVSKHYKNEIEDLEKKSLQVIKSQQIWSVLKNLIRFIRALLILLILYFFLDSVLSLFPWTRYVSNTLLGYVTTPLISMGHAIIEYLPNLFFLTIFFIIFRYLISLTYTFFNGVDRGQIKFKGFDAEWAWPTYRIVRFLLIIFAIVISYPYLPGSGSAAFKGISLLLGVLFSIGSSSLIANIIAGYTMTYRRAFKVGDRVKIGDNIGEVTNIRLMVTHLQSFKNEEIVIPNSAILNGEIINFTSLSDKFGLILHTTVGIGYEVPWRQVEAMLLMAAERTSGLHRRSQPFVLQTGLGDFGVTYELNVFSKKPEIIPRIYSDLHSNIQDVFNEYEVAIMTPHYTGDTTEPKTVPKDQWYASPARPAPPEIV